MDPQSISQQPQPTESVTPKPNRPFLLPLIIGCLLLIIIVGIGAFYLEKKQTLQLPVTNLTPTASTFLTPTLVPTAVQDEMANWKVYSDSKYHLAFKYPNNLNLLIPKLQYGQTLNLVLSDMQLDENGFPTKESILYIHEPNSVNEIRVYKGFILNIVVSGPISQSNLQNIISTQ